MTEKKRIKDCNRFKETDKISWQIDCTTETVKRVIGELKLQELSFAVLGKNVYKYNSF